MDGLSSATSVIAVIQLTGSIVKICGSYIQEAKNARDEILELQQAVTDLEGVLRELNVLLQSPNGSKLSSSQTLASSITRCRSTLEALEEILQPGRRKQAMRRLGLRALAWPIKRKQAKGIASDLQEYKSTFTLSLQIDQI
ncbi:hypothetical protein PEX1_080080 [Penicillium expansum]|uniref:Azaphilone pigments biosynthesis cluster protein L N-terminal domain-containing protein n=1 Tax=Penicillium expansum TaxID=27334 RepID=A0A0A2KR33_PENEN|nr:hypothetical protein PEX2_083870 [Penicillium expansum]KGO43643.1 hypothetical protein PEXP_095450 [Penicillium expansum]KGO52671.1 hypothetical protein PEX2_083870 [Penicillium expansum]KGO70184.1 hypothetical protein PEX1_080080 [Penicillium expansum]